MNETEFSKFGQSKKPKPKIYILGLETDGEADGVVPLPSPPALTDKGRSRVSRAVQPQPQQ
jgi:hypothetical protein